MPHVTLQENWKLFSDLIQSVPGTHNDQMRVLTERYIGQNISILNEVLSTSIENLQRLQTAQSSNEVICTQARLTNELSKKLSLSAQRFINASLGHIADYNDWLKAHCDFATD